MFYTSSVLTGWAGVPSRVIYGARFTLSLGLVGVCMSVLLGIFFGGIAGYYGGRIDWVVMRVVEYIISLPTIPIWLALATALPRLATVLAISVDHPCDFTDWLDRVGLGCAREIPGHAQ